MSATVASSMQSSANANASAFLMLVEELLNPSLRENALAELSKQREQLPDLAIILWNRFGNLPALMKLPFNGHFRCCHGFVARNYKCLRSPGTA